MRMMGREHLSHAAAVLVFCVGYFIINNIALRQIIFYAQAESWASVRNQIIISTISAIILFSVILTTKTLVRALLLLAFAISAFINTAYSEIAGNVVDFDVTVWLMEENGQTSNIFESYPGELLWSGLIVVSGLTACWLGVRLHETREWKITQLLPGRMALLLSLTLIITWNGVLFAVASTRHPHESSMLTYAIASRFFPPPHGEQVSGIDLQSTTEYDKVVLIVDESVRYDYFQATVSREFTALGFIDFGEAVSFSPCSAASNAIMRWGFRRDINMSSSVDPRSNPKIWRYAKKAGFDTYLIDGQQSGPPQNFMGSEEAADVDVMEVRRKSDTKIARELHELLRDNARKFIYVIKNGAHYRYDKNYSAEIGRYLHYRSQSYAAAILSNTSGFAKTITAGLDMNRVLVIYTSDHGQRLDGSGASHCNASPHRDEYSVPLLILAGNKKWEDRLRALTLKNRGVVSHLQIFPTILLAFGYNKSDIVSRYIGTIFDHLDKGYVLTHPYKPFPTLRTGILPIRTIDSIDEIGPKDSTFDPPLRR